MKCPHCESEKPSRVISTSKKHPVIRRRRQCSKCNKRFSTFETAVCEINRFTEWSDEDTEKLLRMFYQEGKTYKEIAAELGRGVGSIAHRKLQSMRK